MHPKTSKERVVNMPLNKQKGNMYSFITHTWNPLAGECSHKCSYCSTNILKRYPILEEKYSGEIRLVESELNTNLGKNNMIFVAAQNDLFAKDVQSKIIEKVIKHCNKYKKNKYLFQTKNPERLLEFEYPFGSILGTTIENDENNESKAPSILKRIIAIKDLYEFSFYKKMITIEPVLDFNHDKLLELIQIARPDIIHIGAVTGGYKLPEPSKAKVEKLIKGLQSFDIKIKSNLERIIK